MKKRNGIRKIAAVGVLTAGIILMWQLEENSSVTNREVQAEPQQKVTETASSPRPITEQFVEINQDVVGYILIPGTNVDYPVLMGKDNEYYLNHNIYGEEEKAGCIMADYKYQNTKIREKFQRHTLVYGHYMAAKTMFTSVAKYKDQEFFESHPYLYFSNLKKTGKWRVFSVYVLDANEETLERKFKTDKEYINYLNNIKKRSRYAVDVELNKDSKVLTLCTCSYETENARAIVHAVLEDE